MSIIKVVKKSGKSHKAMRSVLKYVAEKSEMKEGINCSSDYAEAHKQFIETKKFYHKIDGRQYRHYIQSFDPEEITQDKALEIGVEWANKAFKGHEIYVVTHIDKDHIHNHFIVNTVNFETGYKLHETEKDLVKRKELNDEVSKRHGIKQEFVKKESGQILTYDIDKYQVIKKGADITKLAENILIVTKKSYSVNEFCQEMEKLGYYTEWSEHKKHITFTVNQNILNGKKDKFRLENLRKTFSIELFQKENLLEQFIKNKENNLSKLSKNLNDNFEKNLAIKKNSIKQKKNVKVRNNEIEL